ncbi:hypothetical protein Sme01_54330 [Sphaerisporangium melleum]|uniref:Mycothiol-dependent maleylpyruvate isomerase metal-binding domain-containing protein n=1 Tax=Sphaerisporangium melleum TaxID=321316 RepID=A0A917R6G6_9ACTN|nr:maleylpyruvate isomerase N-terminal domain-containing protein [Sphaerisporangium melleum]GGK91943.1 hypothetical protein GCM10007964_38190 [Sphaerisporangium melleum]GII72957.1 hypothetical protein Sme01_54330 [Sphaerisporangium melleum]
MTQTRDDFLSAARAAVRLLRDPAVAEAWDRPSALAEFQVSGLAGHLAYQILVTCDVLAGPEPQEEVVPLLEHYNRANWMGRPVEDEFNVRIRAGGEKIAGDGPADLVARTEAAVEELERVLPERSGDRPVRMPLWGPWSLSLDDLLISRMMELLVHSDDLAVSVGVATPEVPPSAAETVLDLLTRLAVRRHGPVDVLRALSRAERAPATIAAF